MSPTEAAEFAVECTEEAQDTKQRPSKVERLSSWFEGSSEPVNIGLVASPKKEGPQPSLYSVEGAETMFSGSQESIDSSTSSPRPAVASANSSRFSFFRKPQPAQAKPQADDLANVDIKEILFPEGPIDEFSPAAFKNLQQNAEGALRLFQNAYKDNQIALRKTTSEKNIQSDEMEASDTRNEHLKMQLLEMAERAAEQEKLIASLQAEVEQRKVNETALRSIRVITDHTSTDQSTTQDHFTQRPQRSRPFRANRSSDISYTDSLDSDSVDLSTTASIFSHDQNNDRDLRSPGTSIGCPSPVMKHACVVVTPNIHNPPEHFEPPMPQYTEVVQQVMECQKCHGLRPHEAWEVVSMMKMESTMLKGRITELELAQHSALDLLSCLSMDFKI